MFLMSVFSWLPNSLVCYSDHVSVNMYFFFSHRHVNAYMGALSPLANCDMRKYKLRKLRVVLDQEKQKRTAVSVSPEEVDNEISSRLSEIRSLNQLLRRRLDE
jgi:hypothetical protein